MADIEKIAKLLALADAAATPEEAEAAIAKAQQLATFNGIELEMARQAQHDRTKREVPITKQIKTGDRGPSGKGLPGNKYFVWLATRVAHVNDIKLTISHRADNVNAYGLPSDIAVMEALFTSLSMQMVRFAADDIAAGKHKAQDLNARIYKNNFMEAFVETIGHRLSQARNAAIQESKARDEEIAARVAPLADVNPEAVLVPRGTDLVLRTKQEEVADFYKRSTAGRIRGSWTERGTSNVNYSARRSGAEAGQKAALRGTQSLPSGRQALGG